MARAVEAVERELAGAGHPRSRGLYRSLGFEDAGRQLELTRRVAPGR